MPKLTSLIPKSLLSRIRAYSLRGDRVECPVCEGKFITFLPAGVPPEPMRPHAMCPACGSLERTRLYRLQLDSEFGFFTSPKKILHVAPEPALFQMFRRFRFFNYHPIDKFEPGYTYPAETMHGDVTDLDYSDRFFDYILCSHVLEHVPDDMAAMRELKRVLKPGGYAVVQSPVDWSRAMTYEDASITRPDERAKAFGQADHVRLYGRDYVQRLEEAGFQVKVTAVTDRFSRDEIFRYGLDAEDRLVVGS